MNLLKKYWRSKGNSWNVRFVEGNALPWDFDQFEKSDGDSRVYEFLPASAESYGGYPMSAFSGPER